MKCPYCKEPVIQPRSLDFICKYCHKKIYVRVNPVTRVMDYLTKDEVQKFDTLMDKVYIEQKWKSQKGERG